MRSCACSVVRLTHTEVFLSRPAQQKESQKQRISGSDASWGYIECPADGLASAAAELRHSAPPFVLAVAAWALGRVPCSSSPEHSRSPPPLARLFS